MDIEAIRKSFLPSNVRILFIGESPPASGKFFYIGSGMTMYTARAFERAHGTTFSDVEIFLKYFKSYGCYLDDLSHEPVDNLSPMERDLCLKENIASLSQRIRVLNPGIVIIVLRKIEKYVQEAMNKAGCKAELFVLPFPGNGHQNKYIDFLSKIIVRYMPIET